MNLKNAALSAAALKAVLAFMYTERLDVAIEEVDAVLRVAKKCKMHAVVKAIGEEMRTLKYYFKSTRRDEAPRRSNLFRLSSIDQRTSLQSLWHSDGCTVIFTV